MIRRTTDPYQVIDAGCGTQALARSGVGQLTLVDLDEVCISNINRQVQLGLWAPSCVPVEGDKSTRLIYTKSKTHFGVTAVPWPGRESLRS